MADTPTIDHSLHSYLIDAFLWIAPVKGKTDANALTTKVLWHCPDNIKRLATEFKEIPQFCFPDLHRLPLEKAQDGTGDFIVFTLANDTEGQTNQAEQATQFYGICYRYLFRGNGRRFDAGRRHRHCLCIVSRYPHFSFFRTLLMNVYAIALLEERPSQCKKYVESLFGQIYLIYHNQRRLFHTLEPTLLNDSSTLTHLRWAVPITENSALRDFNILTLFEVLGIEKFFNLISAILCEKRIVMVADAINTLSSAIIGALAAIHPFKWNHLLITMLPLNFISYINNHTAPYIIGIQRSIFSTMRKDILQGIIVIDLDNGNMRIPESVVVRDIVGDANSTLKQATESFDRVRAGMASVFLGKTNDTDASQRDFMTMMVSDMKSILSSKPGSSTLQSVASGLLRGLPGTGKTIDEAKLIWMLESEKTLREHLTMFYVFLFADVDDLLSNEAMHLLKDNKHQQKYDVRSKFASHAFITKKAQGGASKLLQNFLTEFLHTELFEKFCHERIVRILTPQTKNLSLNSVSNKSNGSGPTNALDPEDLYEVACLEVRNRQLQLNSTNAKVAVSAASNTLSADTSYNANTLIGSNKVLMTSFHASCLQYTSGVSGVEGDLLEYLSYDPDQLTGIFTVAPYYRNRSNSSSISGNSHLEHILTDIHSNVTMKKILHTLWFRLDACRAANGKGVTGLAGVKALLVLQLILIEGPATVLSSALDLLPLIRSILRLNPAKNASGLDSIINTTTTISNGTTISSDPRLVAARVLALLLDQRKLQIQRLHKRIKTQEKHNARSVDHQDDDSDTESAGNYSPRKASTASYSSASSGVTVPIQMFVKKDVFLIDKNSNYKKFPRFTDVQKQFNDLNFSNSTPGALRCNPFEKVQISREEDDEDDVISLKGDGTSTNNTPYNSTNMANYVPPSGKRASMGNTNTSAANRTSLNSSSADQSFNASNDAFPVTNEAKYRLANLDTGEELDIREYEYAKRNVSSNIHSNHNIPTTTNIKPTTKSLRAMIIQGGAVAASGKGPATSNFKLQPPPKDTSTINRQSVASGSRKPLPKPPGDSDVARSRSTSPAPSNTNANNHVTPTTTTSAAKDLLSEDWTTVSPATVQTTNTNSDFNAFGNDPFQAPAFGMDTSNSQGFATDNKVNNILSAFPTTTPQQPMMGSNTATPPQYPFPIYQTQQPSNVRKEKPKDPFSDLLDLGKK